MVASDAANLAAQQAAIAARKTQDSLTRATQALQSMQAAQQAARDAARSSASTVTNGLSAGGLVVDPRVTAGTDTSLWQNIGMPGQTTSGGRTTVTLKQNAQRAVATWQQFNVGRNTTVYFDQSAGNSDTGNPWVVLNRIDATGSPSQIQGQIRAEGTVLIINPNGIIFSGSSQINVHSLIASAMDLNSVTSTAAASRNGAFLASGDAYVPVLVNGLPQRTANGTLILAPSDEANANSGFVTNGLFANGPLVINAVSTGNTALFSAGAIPGQSNLGIRVEAGASIATDISGFDNGGFVALLGPQVSNAGSIMTSAGQIILAAGSSVQIAEPAAGTVQVGNVVRAGSGTVGTLLYTPAAVNGGALVLNDFGGVLVSQRGNVTLNGDAVNQSGLVESTTSITRAGSITIVANGVAASNQVNFGTQSLTTILPDENGESIPSDAISLANFTAPRIDIAAPYVDFRPGSWVLAPSATMSVTTVGQTQADNSTTPPLGRVLMESGSVIDLSGLTATRSVSDYLYTFKVTANDVADTPLAQSLIGKTVTIDLSLTGTRADGETWVGSPLFASSGAGYLANITQHIDQLMTKGGSLTFSNGISVGNGQNTGGFTDIVQAAGSVLNISGGSIQYSGAQIATTQLIGGDGRRYDIGSANPFIGIAGMAGQFTVDHAHWGVVETFSNPLIGRGYYKPGYVNGISAGGIALTAVNPILDGEIVDDIVIGMQQRRLAQAGTGTGGAQATPDQLPNGGSLAITLVSSFSSAPTDAVVLAVSAPVLSSGVTLSSPLVLPNNGDGRPVITYATDRLSAFGLGSISISGASTLAMADGASLSVRDGGSIKLASATTIDGSLTAHGGSITVSGVPVKAGLSAMPSLIVGAHALLDVSGRWINDSDGFVGPLYIDGGSVSLSAFNFSKDISTNLVTGIVVAEDRSPSIILRSGSVIDVSSGGYVGSNGRLALGADGLGKGKGGNLSLLTYAAAWTGSTGVTNESDGHANKLDYAPQTATNGNVVMDGTIYAAGQSQGGTFTLQAPQIVIDGQAGKVSSITSGADAGTVVLPTSFFTDSGFGSFKLTSTYGSTTVTAGTTLTLKQQNYLTSSLAGLPASGARLRDFASLGYALDGMRHAVDLTLTQSAYAWGVAGDRSATAQLLIDQSARIVGDPRANISLNAGGPAVVLGSITAPGGSIAITQGFTPRFALLHDGLPQYVWIGENAVLDVSGGYVPNPLVSIYATGSVLQGGTIALSSTGTIIALAGSMFDISGANGTVQQPVSGAGFGRPHFVAQPVWSNGGSLTLSTSNGGDASSYHSLYFAGTIEAAGGAPQAAGGTLNLAMNTGGIVISQSGNVAAAFGSATPTSRTQLRNLSPTTGAVYAITADTIDTANSGLDTVSFLGALYFAGNVDLKVAGSILIANSTGPGITLLPSGVINTAFSVPACAPASCIPTIGHTNVTLEAGYIRFTGASASANDVVLPTLADGTFTLKASVRIDLVGVPSVRNAGTVNLVSDGDIRLTGTFGFSNTTGATSDGNGGLAWAGAFLVADNLNMTAREIYPTTGTAFLLMSLGLAPAGAPGTHGTIAFASSGATPVTPLSAGGAIVVDARTIVQGGALYAPLGTIQLGFGSGQSLPGLFTAFGTGSDPYDPLQQSSGTFGLLGPRVSTVSTDSVTLLPGSLTSVSANGMTIPYGNTTDGTDWVFNNTLLNGPPAKLLVLGGSRIDTQSGAVIDGSGGGEIYATEFVPGTGGSRNVLTTTSQTVYALVPGYNSALAASDQSFTTAAAAGATVTIAGGNGVPGGTYTLMPAEYATLPGAYRVVVVSTNAAPGMTSNVTADGSVYMAGVLGNAINGTRSPQTALLQIQSNSVWSRYSEIDIAKGADYFSALAAFKGSATPRLAQDAARMVVTASSSLLLNATNRFAPGDGGLGGQLDITGANLVVAASDLLSSFGATTNGVFTPNSAYAGYLFLDADMLSRLGIESTLIGGYRSNTTEGTRINASALNLEIATDAAHALTGPELLFASLAPTAASASVRGLVVDAGSVIAARGAVSGRSSAPLVIGIDPAAINDSSGALTGWTAGVSGDGALLRVSNGGLVDVIRHFVPGIYQAPSTTPAPTGPVSTVARGSLAIGAGAVLSGNTLTLDSSGTTTVPVSASLTARNYDLSGAVINLGDGSGGLVISADLIGKFAGADTVRLRSGSVFNVYGNNTFGDASNPIGTLTLDGAGLYSDGGTTTIDARNIVLVNSQATANVNGANTGGAGGHLVLGVDDTLTFGGGTKTLAGFAGIAATAGSKVLFAGSGSLDAKAAAVALTAPLFLVGASTSQSLATTGKLSLALGANPAPALDPTLIGGSLALMGGSIDVNGTLAALGGSLTLEATTSDLTLSGNAVLSAGGSRIAIGDLIQDTPAGNIRLFADLGGVNLGAGTTVDVSGAGSGYAGSLSIFAANTATLKGTLNGAARYRDLGGEFALIAGQLDGGLPLGAGFTRSFQASLGTGDIVIGAGQTLTSQKVLLVANSGGIFVDGTIDASAASGGSIALYGAGSSTATAGTPNASGVTIGANARLYARYQAADPDSPGYANGTSTLVQRGGTITLGTTGTPDGTLDLAYGYQNVPGSGAITVASGAIFDVSGGAHIDNTGGSVIVRAPILINNSINVAFNGTVVTNAKSDGTASGSPLVVNAFAVWSTTDGCPLIAGGCGAVTTVAQYNALTPQQQAQLQKHFDGIIDPAGFFDATQTNIGTTAAPNYQPHRIITADANGLYPTSTADSPASGAYLPHVNFYQTTLLNFVNAPFDTNAVATSFAGAKLQVGANAATALPASALHLRPEIDLVNPSASVVNPSTGLPDPSTGVNSGNITVASNWNFGAGSLDASGNVNLLYRTTNGSEPGTLVLRAINNVRINASISDGFFVNYVYSNSVASAASLYDVEVNSSAYLAYLAMFSADGYLQYDTSVIYSSFAASGVSWGDFIGDPNFPIPPSSGALASANFFGISSGLFESLQFTLQKPTILNCGGGTCSVNVIDQYNQIYAQYVRMFDAYAQVTTYINKLAGPANNGVAGGFYMPYQYIIDANNYEAANWGYPQLDMSRIAIPAAPSLGSSYYNFGTGIRLSFDSGTGFTTAVGADYASQWAAYFFSIMNMNALANSGASLADLGLSVPSSFPAIGKILDLNMTSFFSFATTPPYAPPAYTSVASDYVSSLTVNPTPPTNMIANNPATYSPGNVAYRNTTSSADLMTAVASGKGSFSYDFVGGAQFNADGASAVNPNAVVQLSTLSSTVTGNVTLDGHTSYGNPFSQNGSQTLNIPTLVRTGTGSITIAAAGDFALLDNVAPGAVYTAGYVADNAAGFTAPTLPALPDGIASNGRITTPVWARGGGDITVTAGRDIIGIETPVDPTGSQFSPDGSSAGVSTGEFWSAWYYVNGKSAGGAAPFDPSKGGVQFSSWINYGSFFQGFGALGGGDITLQAGRNVKDVSASLPETIQMSGGQSASGPAAVAHYYGGGDLLVQAGNDVLSGVYYVGRGTGSIRAGGNVISDATLFRTVIRSSALTSASPQITDSSLKKALFSLPLLLAVQDGAISVQAAGSIDLGGIFEPTVIPGELTRNVLFSAPQNQIGAAVTLPSAIGASFDSFGVNSGVTLLSSTGSVAVNSLATNNFNTLFTHTSNQLGFVGGATPSNIPPNLSVTALTGNIQLANGTTSNTISLSASPTGQLSLVAGGSIVGQSVSGNGALFPSTVTMSDTLEHTGDDAPVLIYAGQDISGGIYNIAKPARLWAGRDIANLRFTGTNLDSGDITSIVAGRDIAAQRTAGVAANSSALYTLLMLYGPGDFVVDAGRNLGPLSFVDRKVVAAATTGNPGGGIFAVGDGSNRTDGQKGDMLVKPYLPLNGANITLRYGVGTGIDYAAAIATYGDAATASASGIDFVSGIVPQLEQFVDQLIVQRAKAAGIANPAVAVSLSPADAADLFTALPTLAINGKLTALAAKAGFGGLAFDLTPAQFVGLLQQQEAMKLTIDRGFLAVLKQVGLDYNDPSSPYAGKYARAYEAITTLFPAALGYTDNSAGGSGVVPTLKHTGDLRMARSLVETQTGGDINILGPGGNAYVGSNSADTLTPAQQGILTLQGGSVRTYTDESVLIYQSRVFTEQGGNVEMFSANADLNAGKGPKSKAAYPPLRLICDSDGYCRVSPAGLVTGAGIGALLSVPGQDPTLSNVILTAPHGTIDAGAAGIRVAGNLNLVALQVLNAFNIQVGGTAVGIPAAPAANIGALTAGNDAAGAAAKTALPSAQANNNDRPSVIIVEVLGYGGSDGEDNGPARRRRGDDDQTRLKAGSADTVRVLGNGPITQDQLQTLTDEEKILLLSGERRKL